MHLSQFNIDPDTMRSIGREELENAVAQFHPPGECILCHRPLGTAGRFSLLVDDNSPFVTVRPVHAPCMASVHTSSGVARIAADTYRTLPIVLPIEGPNGETVPQPLLLVNAALDQLVLTRDLEGGPPVDKATTVLRDTGWHPVGGKGRFDVKVGTCKVAAGVVSLTGMHGTWESEVPNEFLDAMNHWDGGCFAGLIRRRLIDDFLTSNNPYRVLTEVVQAHDLWTGYFERTH